MLSYYHDRKSYSVMGNLMEKESIQGRCLELMTIWTGSVPISLVCTMNRRLVFQLLKDPR